MYNTVSQKSINKMVMKQKLLIHAHRFVLPDSNLKVLHNKQKSKNEI